MQQLPEVISYDSHFYHNIIIILIIIDSRLCKDRIQGPLLDNNSTIPFHTHVADENNTLTLRCRVICQEHGAAYIPHIRIISTKDGNYHDRRADGLFDSVQSPSNNECNTASHNVMTQDHEFHITIYSDELNESIASCVLFYRSVQGNINETCHTSTIAWIILPNRHIGTTASLPPPTTPVVGGRTALIPEEVSIFFIIMAAVCTCVIMGVLIGGAVFLYKRVSKTQRRKIGAQVTHDGTAATRLHC